jgi:hypothetical protein
MPNISMPPTPGILRMADLIEQAIGRFLEARGTIPPLGKFESDDEAILLFNLVIRDIEAILTLARTDLVLLPAANVLARAVFEIALKAAWIVQPDDPFDREVRWLAHLAEEERMLKANGEAAAKRGGDPASFEECHRQIRDFRMGVARALPTGYSELPGNTGVDKMLENLGQKQIHPIQGLGSICPWRPRLHVVVSTKLRHSEADWRVHFPRGLASPTAHGLV